MRMRLKARRGEKFKIGDEDNKVPTAVHPVGWSIDCLETSGLLRIFARPYFIKCGPSFSSFEIWAIPRKEELECRAKYENIQTISKTVKRL